MEIASKLHHFPATPSNQKLYVSDPAPSINYSLNKRCNRYTPSVRFKMLYLYNQHFVKPCKTYCQTPLQLALHSNLQTHLNFSWSRS